MPVANQIIKFKAGTSDNFKKIAQKDLNTIYFLTDTQQMFVGDTEYTRPILSGDKAPTAALGKNNPPNTLYYDTTGKALYVTFMDGQWIACSNFYVHPSFTELDFTQTTRTLTYGGKFKVPSFKTNDQGHVTEGSLVELTLPAAIAVDITANTTTGDPETLTHGGTFTAVTGVDASGSTITGTTTEFTLPAETNLSLKEGTKTGNAVTSIAVNGHEITVNKDTTFVTDVTLDGGTNNGTLKLTVNGTATDNIEVTGLGSAAYTDSDAYATAAQGVKADNAMPISGGTFTGEVILNADPTKDLGAATKKYVDSKTASLTGAMHFVGVSTTDPKGTTGATVDGHTTWAAGDVVLFGNKEYVLGSTENKAANWHELGDEGSYALKSIKITGTNGLTGNGDLSANCEISHAGKAASLANVTEADATFVSSMTFDTYGHPTAVKTTKLAASDGVKLDGNAIKHTNSVPAKTTAGLVKVAYDAQGHITKSVAAEAADILTADQLKAVNSGITEEKVTAYAAHVADTDIHVTAAQKTAWTAKQDALVFNTAYNASTNKAATMADIQAAALVWGSFDEP
nr:hypothetical protein DGKKSRWO_DGKKSRWO_CDS_0186 [uncultured phage]CAI9752364.1 hypothetical protein CVNMHQAP_CVNMHQAP_CDS_0187 [uncultured phage]